MTARGLVTASLLAVALAGCGRDRPMAGSADLPDTARVRRAMTDAVARESLLDTMPGGEMARGDSAAEVRLLHDKTPD